LRDGGNPKIRAILLLELAATHLGLGSLSEGLDLSEQALSGVLTTEMTWGVPKLRDVSRLLQTIGGQRANELAQQIAALAGSSL
jgi:Rad3-related DNA helicase